MAASDQAEYLEGFSDPTGRLAPADLRLLLGEAAHQGYAQLAGVVDPASLQKVRAYKQENKAAAKARQVSA